MAKIYGKLQRHVTASSHVFGSLMVRVASRVPIQQRVGATGLACVLLRRQESEEMGGTMVVIEEVKERRKGEEEGDDVVGPATWRA